MSDVLIGAIGAFFVLFSSAVFVWVFVMSCLAGAVREREHEREVKKARQKKEEVERLTLEEHTWHINSSSGFCD